MSKKIAVLLSGSGVYDGSEIQEAVFTLLSIAEHGYEYVCVAPDIDQHHVINHTTGEEQNEKRNVLVESARIARGEIQSLSDFDASTCDALVLPGGFGTAKNHTKWAFEGPEGPINAKVRDCIRQFAADGKPIVGLCMAPTTIAKALEGVRLTVGSTAAPSPYDIAGISNGVNATGNDAAMATVSEVVVDEEHKVITAPCYMMEADILQVRKNVAQAIDALSDWL